MVHPSQKSLGARKYGNPCSSWSVHWFRAIPSVDSTQVAVPYLRAKAHDYYEQLGGGVSSDILEDTGDGRHTQALPDGVCCFLGKNMAMLIDIDSL